MTSYVFETMTAGDAANFTSSDMLLFSAPSLRPADVEVGNSDDSSDRTTLTAGGKALVFAGAQLAGAAIRFQSAIDAQADFTLQLGSFGVDHITLESDDNGGVVYGFSGDDVIHSRLVSSQVGIGNSVFLYAGYTGAENIFGGGGDDTIEGGASGDHLYGFGLTGNFAADGGDLIFGQNGNDYIQGNGGDDTLDGGNGNDRINGGAGADHITGGFDGNDTVNGNRGDDNIQGANGNDSLRGGADNDRLDGGDGNDVLLGDLGNDILLGNAGIDVLTGGGGRDRFLPGPDLPVADGPLAGFVDTITDFVVGEDYLELGTNGRTTDDVLHAAPGRLLSSLGEAMTYAQQLLDGHAGTNDIAVLEIGSDAYLFYGSFGASTINGVFKLAGVDAATISSSDFFFNS